MGWREISPEDAEAFGKRIYQDKVRPMLYEEPIGSFLAVDLDSEDWELDESLLKAARRLRERKPDADVFAIRVGFPAAFTSLSP